MFDHPTIHDETLAIVGKDEYLTYTPTEYYWTKGGAKFRIVYPAGQQTDLASSPWFGRLAGFKKEDKRWWRGCKIHDALCWVIRHANGVCPPGMYQFENKEGEWQDCIFSRWTQKQADELAFKIWKEDGFGPKKSAWAYRMIRTFGWAHRLFT